MNKLITKAKETRATQQTPFGKLTKEHIELALAYLNGEITALQFASVMPGCKLPGSVHKIVTILKYALRNKMVEIRVV